MSTKAASKAIFPGSFDPITNGHTDIIERSLTVFDQIVVAILSNPEKNTLYSLEERVELLRMALIDYKDRIIVKTFSGLLVDFARAEKANVIVRGLRAISDYDYEAQMAIMNKNLSGGVETVFMITSESSSYISSSLVKQIARFKGDVSGLVPVCVAESLKNKFK